MSNANKKEDEEEASTTNDVSTSFAFDSIEQHVLTDSIVYENDFDLYNLHNEMLNNSIQNETRNSGEPNTKIAKKSRVFKKNPFKNYKKSLTASLLESHSTNGTEQWQLINKGIDLYRIKTKCIGTEPSNFDYGEPIYLDLQPLSTRIKLMCKLIIIIQGACLERGGPPKLVQDRCIQFDGISNVTNDNLTTTIINNGYYEPTHKKKTNLKANSLDNLLCVSTESLSTIDCTTPENALGEESEDDSMVRMSVFGTSRSNSNKMMFGKIKHFTSSHMSSCNIQSSNSILKKSNKYSKEAMSDDELLAEQCFNNSSKRLKQNASICTVSTCSRNDLDNYFIYNNKYSSKDYVSAPYYQYSYANVLQFKDQSMNTSQSFLFQSFLDDFQKKNNFCDKSTSTDGLISGFFMGYYSKAQLFSSQTLFEKKSSLMNSFASITLEPIFKLPVTVDEMRNQQSKQASSHSSENQAKEVLVQINNKENKPQASKLVSQQATPANQKQETNQNTTVKSGLKKSCEWEIFKNRKPNNQKKSSCSSPAEQSKGKVASIINNSIIEE
jgi:hypothetical protein